MRAVLTAVIAAIEGVAVALAGLAVVVVPALLLWMITFDLSAEPGDMLGGATSVWFLAHFVPLEFSLSGEAAVALGFPQEPVDFPLSLAPLGLTLITVALAARSGWRFGQRGGAGAAGALGGAAGFAVVASVVAPLAVDEIAWPYWAAVLVPGLVYGVASAATYLVRAAREGHPWWEHLVRLLQRGISSLRLPASGAFPDRAAAAIRLAAASLAALAGLSAVAVAVALVVGYVQVATLSQSLQLDPLGAVIVFLLQVAVLPAFVIWSAAWLSGAGFAVGVGSSATPFEALLGPMPSLPLFGAIPQGWGAAGLLAPTLVVLASVGVGAAFARRPLPRRSSWLAITSIAAGASLVVGFACVGAGALARGGIGPDRLAEAGPEPWIFGGLVAAEWCAGLLLGIVAARLDLSRLRPTLLLGGARTAGDPSDGVSIDPLHRREASAGPPDAADHQETVPLDGVRADGIRHGDHQYDDARPDDLDRDAVALDSTRSVPASSDSGPPVPASSGTGSADPAAPDTAATDTTATDVAASEVPAADAAPEDDHDELLRAFSWDQPVNPTEQEQHSKRRGRRLRLPRRGDR